ncbi:MAG: hypothetical protein CVV47_02750 [Spirochaetae bacterium HGW-Spirochaetae-3]|jgi:hypothetical protein|nr:MAG: hypothetical protein CVV47_02750 [Spirochaetae bacterium HGW-Spirochaetae-3]
MRSLSFIPVVCLALLASCVSSPTPAPQQQEAPDTTAPADDGSSQAYKDRAKALVQGGSATGSATSQASSSGTESAAATESVDAPPPAPGVMTPEEEAFLNNYLARLQYMVYFDESAGIDPKNAKVAVNQANRYLIEKLGLSVVDFDQIEKNKKDQQAAYQSETGGSIDLIQYIAQKYNADVYVEISFSSTSSASGGKFYSAAQGSMKIFDTSTAQLLGSVAFQSPQVMSPSSAESAISNAVAASVWTAMPKMTEQSRTLVKNSMSRGIRYEVLIQNTPDSRQISTLRRALARVVREVEQVSYSPSETKLALYTFKSRDKLEDAMYDAADRAGLLDLYLVYSRGKAFTFNSGL